MKFLLLSYVLALVVPFAQAVSRPMAVVATTRGGAALGPLDSDMALKLSKTAATAYVAASASKYITKETGGGGASNLASFLTGDLFQLHALITAISCAMFSFSSEFDAMKSIAAFALLALGLKLKDDLKLDTLTDNATQAVIAVILAVIAFVDL